MPLVGETATAQDVKGPTVQTPLASRPTATTRERRITAGLDRLALTLALYDVLLREDDPQPATR